MILFCLLALVLAACGIAARGEGSSTSSAIETCPVTLPSEPAFVPPDPYPAQPPFKGEFWYGSPSLWTLLPQDGVWRGLPFDEGSGYTQKVFFWTEGYDPSTEPQPDLVLRGVRLDADGESFETDHATNAMGSDIGSAMLVGVEIPSAGCWQFTGSYGDEELTFTLQVDP